MKSAIVGTGECAQSRCRERRRARETTRPRDARSTRLRFRKFATGASRRVGRHQIAARLRRVAVEDRVERGLRQISLRRERERQRQGGKPRGRRRQAARAVRHDLGGDAVDLGGQTRAYSWKRSQIAAPSARHAQRRVAKARPHFGGGARLKDDVVMLGHVTSSKAWPAARGERPSRRSGPPSRRPAARQEVRGGNLLTAARARRARSMSTSAPVVPWRRNTTSKPAVVGIDSPIRPPPALGTTCASCGRRAVERGDEAALSLSRGCSASQRFGVLAAAFSARRPRRARPSARRPRGSRRRRGRRHGLARGAPPNFTSARWSVSAHTHPASWACTAAAVGTSRAAPRSRGFAQRERSRRERSPRRARPSPSHRFARTIAHAVPRITHSWT